MSEGEPRPPFSDETPLDQSAESEPQLSILERAYKFDGNDGFLQVIEEKPEAGRVAHAQAPAQRSPVTVDGSFLTRTVFL